MPPKRSLIGTTNPHAKRMREVRERETAEEREARLAANRTRTSQSRANETAVEPDVRLSELSQRRSELRATETSQRQRLRLNDSRMRMAELRAAHTEEQSNIRREANRRIQAATRAAAEQHEHRLRNGHYGTICKYFAIGSRLHGSIALPLDRLNSKDGRRCSVICAVFKVFCMCTNTIVMF
ncbi:unnamed protein product [Cylicocyclus nassatus]|uniref:Uncharacterized protein n=1 Tax=Cylicocyclus nassatus TaxID=53992 RepID=A0AA36M3V2_CYLNA|nr:unnamed protein product [Cylicocyclus nassatus]